MRMEILRQLEASLSPSMKLDLEVDVEIRDEVQLGITPLMVAASQKDQALVDYFLRKGASLDARVPHDADPLVATLFGFKRGESAKEMIQRKGLQLSGL